jgi:C-terminal processing protease CtpA/Prc
VNIGRRAFGIIPLITILALMIAPSLAQLTGLDRERAQTVLGGVASDIRKEYYDPKFHGIDWDAKVAEAKAGIAKADSWNAAMIEIAVLTDYLNDSHTVFLPPRPQVRTDYGWHFKVIGVHCYVTQVRPLSDAEAKGVKPGDQVLTLDQIKPTRETLPKIEYAIYGLSQQASLHVSLKGGAGSARPVDIAAKVVLPRKVSQIDHPSGIDWQYYQRGWWSSEHLTRLRFAEMGDDVMIVKVPDFEFLNSDGDKIVAKARRHKVLILDMRDNPGGDVENLQRLLGGMFDHEVKIADKVTRQKTTPLKTKNNHHDTFNGKLIVLVDSGSSSAAELFARAIQVEKRGTVLGDRTSGLVMESKYHPGVTGLPPLYYLTQITEANLIMSDGRSLEHTGVTPDESVLPTPEDLAAGRDPVLSRAAELAGVKLTPEDAGKLFPYEWPVD